MSEVKEEIEIVVTEEQQELVDATIAADKLEDEAAARIKAKYASDSTKNVKRIFHIAPLFKYLVRKHNSQTRTKGDT